MSELAVCAVAPVRMCGGVHFPLSAPNCTHTPTHICTDITSVVKDKGLKFLCVCVHHVCVCVCVVHGESVSKTRLMYSV